MSKVAQPGELLVIFGPPAVGKMTVGRAVCERDLQGEQDAKWVSDIITPCGDAGLACHS